jgi:hypothetical protein
VDRQTDKLHIILSTAQNDTQTQFYMLEYQNYEQACDHLGFKKALFGGAMTYVLGSYLIIMWEDKSWTDEQLIAS